MLKKVLSDRRGIAIEMAILLMVVCFAISVIILSTAVSQAAQRNRAEERLEENIIFEQMVEMWLENPHTDQAIEYKGYIGTVEKKNNKIVKFEIAKADAKDTPLLTLTVDTDGKITGWQKG